MTRDEYLQLFGKYVNGQATPAEIAVLMAYRDDFELSELSDHAVTDDDSPMSTKIKHRINVTTGHTLPVKSKRYNSWYAAVLMVIVIMAVLFTCKNNSSNTTPKSTSTVKKLADEAKPGSEKAILTLANGEQVMLNDPDSSILIVQGNSTIQKQKNGVLHYIVAAAPIGKKQVDEYNTITTPRGGEYHLELPDGSKVWLNAASSLRFPTAFRGEDRKVKLTGEGYFETAKDKTKPFKVNFNDQEVEVLGTRFNIMAYTDETAAITTLLEGSLKISRNNIRQFLLPGQQAIAGFSQNGFKVQQANVQQVMAWKNGFFMFRNVAIDKIMSQASRWYDVNVVYKGEPVNDTYGGRISKYKNITELLRNLELTGTVHFKIEGRRVTVMH